MLTSEMGDSSVDQLDMSDYSHKAVLKMMDYFYCGSIELDDLDTASLLEILRTHPTLTTRAER